MSPSERWRQQGATLIEMLMAVVVIGVVAVTASEYIGKLNTGLKSEDAKSSMMSLADSLRLSLVNLDGIVNSITKDSYSGNKDLASCVGPRKTCPAFAAREDQQRGFYLWSATSTPERIAGPPSDPVGYTDEGVRCTIGTPKCYFGAVTYFWATCPRDAAGVPLATCTDPHYINFRFQIVPLARAREHGEKGRSQKIKEFPRNIEFQADKTAYSIRVKTSDIVQRLRNICPDATKQTGINPDGTPRCECHTPAFDAAGKKRYKPDGTPICAPQTCPSKNDIMVGYKPNGQIKCIDQNVCAAAKPPPECPCETVDLSVNGQCSDGYWLVHIEWGGCYATWAKGKGLGYETVTCDKHSGRCCKLDVQ